MFIIEKTKTAENVFVPAPKHNVTEEVSIYGKVYHVTITAERMLAIETTALTLAKKVDEITKSNLYTPLMVLVKTMSLYESFLSVLFDEVCVLAEICRATNDDITEVTRVTNELKAFVKILCEKHGGLIPALKK